MSARNNDPGAGQIAKRYDIADKGDKNMLYASVEKIRSMLERGRRININDVMLLYGMYAYHVIMEAGDGDGANAGEVERGIRTLVSDRQVMIGVPEMTALLCIGICNTEDGRTTEIVIKSPIGIVADCGARRGGGAA